jgi:hypothetical protein
VTLITTTITLTAIWILVDDQVFPDDLILLHVVILSGIMLISTGPGVIFLCLDHIIPLDASVLAEVNHYRMVFLASKRMNDECFHHHSITKSIYVCQPKLTYCSLVCVQETG